MTRFLHILVDTGLRLRCPVCEQGRLFRDLFTMHRLCPHCSVRFERHEGEVVGGMTISIVATAVIFLVGYFTLESLTQWPVWIHLAMWMSFAVLFPIGFYRYSRALWVVLLHAMGDVYWDYEPYEEPQLSLWDALSPPAEDEPPSPPPPTPSPSPEDDDLSRPRQSNW